MSNNIEKRVLAAASACLAKNQVIAPVDVLAGIGWLNPIHIGEWRRGRTAILAQTFQVGPEKIDVALNALASWAQIQGLEPVETPYFRTSREASVPLQFTADADANRELTFRTHWLAWDLSAKAKAKIEKKSAPADPVVFQILRDSECSECGEPIEQDDLLGMEADKPLGLACANLADLIFLESGDATLTRRASKHSSRKAVVVRFSRSRGRYERKDILIEERALAAAESSCAEDSPQRAEARAKDKKRREQDDRLLAKSMAKRILELFPQCPKDEAERIAAFTATRGSGRVGRSAAGRNARRTRHDPGRARRRHPP